MIKIIQKAIIFFLLLFFLMGCEADESDGMEKLEESEKETASLMDDTYYVADIAGILILCEENENLERRQMVS